MGLHVCEGCEYGREISASGTGQEWDNFGKFMGLDEENCNCCFAPGAHSDQQQKVWPIESYGVQNTEHQISVIKL